MLDLGVRPLVMGVLNVTPDSFAEERSRLDPDTAVDWALQMEADGADLIDIGGESTRPGAEPVDAEKELRRVLPVVARLSRKLRIPISVDTWKADVARAVLRAGAHLINDISGLGREPRLAEAVAEAGAALILMHMRGDSATMYAEARYGDLIGEITAELRASLQTARAHGVADDRTIIDPGIGFAKLPEHSYGVLAGLPRLASGLERPVLVGPSRKSFLRRALHDAPAQQRDWGTAAAVSAAILAGAHIVRVHAVSEMVQVVKVAEEIRRASMGEQPS